MNFIEFLVRILDNIVWAIGSGNPWEIVTALLNIIWLLLDNVF